MTTTAQVRTYDGIPQILPAGLEVWLYVRRLDPTRQNPLGYLDSIQVPVDLCLDPETREIRRTVERFGAVWHATAWRPMNPSKGECVRAAYPAEWAKTLALPNAKARAEAQYELYRRYDAGCSA